MAQFYTKQELAQLYFPRLPHRAAVKKLMRWIRICRPLMASLRSMDYTSTARCFTGKQVEAIFEHLGEP